jgi:transcription initiation factor IIE alpha subunit
MGWGKVKEPHFNGPEYQTIKDHTRLENQHERVKSAMSDHEWKTLEEIAELTGDPVASISAQLRHLRKARFGAYRVERQSRGDRDFGLFEYRLLPPDSNAERPKRTSVREENKILRNKIEGLKEENLFLKESIKALRQQLGERK